MTQHCMSLSDCLCAHGRTSLQACEYLRRLCIRVECLLRCCHPGRIGSLRGLDQLRTQICQATELYRNTPMSCSARDKLLTLSFHRAEQYKWGGRLHPIWSSVQSWKHCAQKGSFVAWIKINGCLQVDLTIGTDVCKFCLTSTVFDSAAKSLWTVSKCGGCKVLVNYWGMQGFNLTNQITRTAANLIATYQTWTRTSKPRTGGDLKSAYPPSWIVCY